KEGITLLTVTQSTGTSTKLGTQFSNLLLDSNGNIIPLDVTLPTTIIPLATLQTSVAVIETPGVHNTGSSTPVTTQGSVPSGGATSAANLTASLLSVTWSKADGSTELLVVDPGHLTIDSVDTANHKVNFTYTTQDKNLDFLAEGEKLTIVYTIKDPDGTVQTVTITATGSEDAPVLASATAPAIQEFEHTQGSAGEHTPSVTLNFTDVDLTDQHFAVTLLASGTWQGGNVAPEVQTALAHAVAVAGDHVQFNTTLHDSTGTGSGSVQIDFSIQDNYLDFLAAGETMTLTFNVQINDFHTGGADTETVVLTFTGENDAPQLAPDASGPHTIGEADAGVSGTLTFTDVDLTDTHTVSAGKPSF